MQIWKSRIIWKIFQLQNVFNKNNYQKGNVKEDIYEQQCPVAWYIKILAIIPQLHLGKPLFEKWSIYASIAQIAFDPSPRM